MSRAELPPPRRRGEYAVALVCLGNICRSPMADVVLTAHVERAGLSDRVTVNSCGTGDWHVGQAMDRRAAATLSAAGFDPTLHRARLFEPSWLLRHDLVLAMDESNLADVTAAATAADDGRVLLFREFDPIGTGGEVPDPYYGGDAGFEEVLEMVERTSAVLVSALERALS
ncbi:low molecular weight protein-tyrosine-phosphatase [Nocardioides dilutus]